MKAAMMKPKRKVMGQARVVAAEKENMEFLHRTLSVGPSRQPYLK